MIVSIHQPHYMPWLGYFEKIARSDVFVLFDSAQFKKNGFMNRNKILTKQGAQWLTVPVVVKGHLDSDLRHTQIDNTRKWQKKHWTTIVQAYGKHPYFKKLAAGLEPFYASSYELFSDICWEMLQFWMELLGIRTRVLRASDLMPSGEGSDLVLDLCLKAGATQYISGSYGRQYLDLEDFAKAGIDVEFQEYTHPAYEQCGANNFVSHLAIVDLCANVEDPLSIVLSSKESVS